MFTKLWKLREGEHEYGPMSNIPPVGVGAAALLWVVELFRVKLVGLEVRVVRDEPVSRVEVDSGVEVSVDGVSCRRKYALASSPPRYPSRSGLPSPAASKSVKAFDEGGVASRAVRFVPGMGVPSSTGHNDQTWRVASQ
jgi:hypothetical protein